MSNEAGHGLGPTRARVLKLLQEAVGPMSVADISGEIGIHKNSARFHLDSLVELGYVTHEKLHTGETGRPRLVYRATPTSPTVSPEHLVNLCQILIRSFVAGLPDAEKRAEEAGYAWGAEHGASSEDQVALEGLAQVLSDQGFAPTISERRIWFDRCPYQATELEDGNLHTVCALHLGIIKGYLESSGSPLTAGELTIGSPCSLTLIDAE
ncbi:MAG TPA: helix-turn-helix domain-containing protein [Arachnia sp.]|nr:helix-turn-helix domain-containing protein [Arachnia sp.]HMT86788.1 helix-turn-helix domain-containing protein [Arachnia sp.]